MNKEMESKVKAFFEEQQSELELAEKKGYNDAIDSFIGFLEAGVIINTKGERDILIASLKDLRHIKS